MADLYDPDPALRTGPDEHEYLLKRAGDHERLAGQARDADARAIHLRLRRLYLEQADRIDMVHQD